MDTCLIISTERKLKGFIPTFITKCGLFKKRYEYRFNSLNSFLSACRTNKETTYENSKFTTGGIISERGNEELQE